MIIPRLGYDVRPSGRRPGQDGDRGNQESANVAEPDPPDDAEKDGPGGKPSGPPGPLRDQGDLADPVLP
jgi:hypothetical protein